MTTQRILEQILVPRPNGSTALERVGSFPDYFLAARPDEPDSP